MKNINKPILSIKLINGDEIRKICISTTTAKWKKQYILAEGFIDDDNIFHGVNEIKSVEILEPSLVRLLSN